MLFFLDTNIFIRFLTQDHQEEFENCVRLFQYIEERKISCITSSSVFAEIVWVLQSFYKFEKSKISHALQSIEASAIRTDDHVDMSFALELYEKHNVKFIDCLIASHRKFQSQEMKIISYDHDFDLLGVERVEPTEIIEK